MGDKKVLLDNIDKIHTTAMGIDRNIEPSGKSELIGRRASMAVEKIYTMSFAKMYPLLVAKAEKKGRTRAEVDEVTCWLTGYRVEQLNDLLERDIAYGDFFLQAPEMNPNRRQIKGAICGVRVETIEEPLMQEIRYLDKLVDELAKGKPMEKILRTE